MSEAGGGEACPQGRGQVLGLGGGVPQDGSGLLPVMACPGQGTSTFFAACFWRISVSVARINAARSSVHGCRAV